MPSPIEVDPRVDPLIGQTLGGKYTLERLVGRGGMGHVYSATVTDAAETSRRDVVVKMIAPPLAQQPQAMARFEREAKRLDGLRHSNIVEMYDYGREGGRAYIVMEWVDGELLSDYMARKGRLTLGEFVPIAAQILKGVGHAHSRDLMIRDIKPANVMLCERKGRANFVKIIDFGLAKMLEGDEDITKQHFIGTSGYLSPEQIKGQAIDLRVDVYALGVLFYQMLSGRMPFEAENDTTLLYKHVHDFPTPLSEVLPDDDDVPDELVHLIHDCLEKDPNDRPRDANEIVERLIDCVPMSMFKLPAATPAAAEQTAISALSTAALAAPTGQTAAYLKIDQVVSEADDSRSLAAASLTTGPTAVVVPPSTGRSKSGWIIGGVVGAAVLAVVGILLFGGGKPPASDGRATVEPAPAAAPTTPAATGTIEISSVPAADLTIDGSPAGNTPYAKPLPVGKHTLELSAEGHRPWTREVEIKAGVNPAIDIKLEPIAAVADEVPSDTPPSDAAPSDAAPSDAPPPSGESKSVKKPGTGKTKPSVTTAPAPEPEPKPKPKPEPEPKKDNPFLPTKKNTSNGPFLPTEK